MSKIGMMLLMVGIASADSEIVLIPLAMVVLGALLLREGEKRHGEEDR